MKRTLEWQIATVSRVKPETAEVKTLTLALPDWTAHRPGQHYDVRLTAEDGYAAQRSYSVASEPERTGEIDITVERIPDGEVSPFLLDTVVVGDRFEVRGPIGGDFLWGGAGDCPLLLGAGRSRGPPPLGMVRPPPAARVGAPARPPFHA